MKRLPIKISRNGKRRSCGNARNCRNACQKLQNAEMPEITECRNARKPNAEMAEIAECGKTTMRNCLIARNGRLRLPACHRWFSRCIKKHKKFKNDKKLKKGNNIKHKKTI